MTDGSTYKTHSTWGKAGDTMRLSIQGLGEQIVSVNSFSKYFGMTGWRLGWLVAPQRYIREIEKLAQNLYIAPSTIAQHAALGDALRIDGLVGKRGHGVAVRSGLMQRLSHA